MHGTRMESSHARSQAAASSRSARLSSLLARVSCAFAVPIETAELPERCVLLFGQEGPGLTPEARAAAATTVSIAQFGSTRSINAGVAAGIAMHAWVRQHADLGADR